MSRRLSGLLLLPFLLGLLLLVPARVWAGPVSWREVPATAEGRQWWDEGSLRRNRSGHLTVLSRFQAAPDPDRASDPDALSFATSASAGGPAAGFGSSGGPGASARIRLTDKDSDSDAQPAAPVGSLPAAVDQRSPASPRSAPPISRLYVMELDCDQSLYRDISINGLPQFGASWQPTGSDDLTAEVLRQACAAEAA